MKNYIILIALVINGCRKPLNNQLEYSFPPEWAPQEAIWADFASEWAAVPNAESKALIISSLSNYIKTNVVYDNDSLKQVAVEMLHWHKANMDSIAFVKTSSPMNWIRDPGPIFVTNGDSLKVIDFKWSCYGRAYDCENDFRGIVNDELAKQMNMQIDFTDIFLEGGGVEVSSNSILAYRAMAQQRNPDKSIEEVTSVLLNSLGKEQVIWLDEFPLIDKPYNKIANYFGQGANGHIDVTTRFLNDSTILATVIAGEDKDKSPLLKRDFEILNSNLEQLKKVTQPDGSPYNIITIEAPDYTLYEYTTTMQDYYMYSLPEEVQKNFKIGDTIKFVPALEYANFLITNGAILVSEYWKEGMPENERKKDEKIKSILKEYFPERDIISLDILPINWGGGGIHCRTQQQPKLN